MKKVVISVGGSAINPGKIDIRFLKELKRVVLNFSRRNKVILVCGGGYLAREYINLLISMIIPEGNYLEFELLLCGVIWGIGRVAGVNPELTKEAVPYLKSFLNSENPVLRGYSCWALKKIGVVFNGDALEINCAINDDSLVDLYSDNKFYKYKVSTLAKQLIQSSN